MNDVQKNEIKDLLNIYMERFTSQAKGVDTLKNVAEPTIINMRKGNWSSISDNMWRNVGKQVGYSSTGTWRIVHTSDFNKVKKILNDAREFSNVFAIEAKAGGGKTGPASWYKDNNPNTYYVLCSEYYNRKQFLRKLLEGMGKVPYGNVAEMMDTIVDICRKEESPVIILDEVDKLNDQVLYFFITLYNMLEDKCGIVLMATEHFRHRIERGIRLNKKGYSEMFSRFGSRFITLKGTSKEEITKICQANGVNDPIEIATIYNEYKGDLRRVKRSVHKYTQKREQNTAQ